MGTTHLFARLPAALAVLMFCSTMARAEQGASGVEQVKVELRAFLVELNAALAARDGAALEKLYADEFLFVHALGAPVNKADHIASTLKTPPSGGSLPISSLDNLLVFGDVAVLRQPVDGRFGTTIYVRRNGRWQVLQLQGTPTPSTRPAAAISPDLLRDYVGRYQQDNGLFVAITLEGASLVLQVDGRQKLMLSAESNTQFTLPAGAGQLTFTSGGRSYEIRRGNGSVVKGIRVQ